MKHELVQFENGSYSLRSPVSGEAMHSVIGAWEEARQIYIKGTGLKQRLESPNPLVIYDVGLGIAANALAAYDCFRSTPGSAPLTLISFESDLDGLRIALAEKKFPFLESYRAMVTTLLENHEFREAGFQWRVIEGDFLAIQQSDPWQALPRANLVFYDFYSPDTNSQLWDESVLAHLRERLHPDALLATYCCRKSVVKNLLLAGFWVGEGAATGAKKVTTVASTDWPLRYPVPTFNKLDERWFARLKQSPIEVSDQDWARLRSHPQFLR